MQTSRMGDRRGNIDRKTLTRAVQYLARYRWQAIIPYLFLVIATLAQLMVPRMLGNIIDAITQGAIANGIVPRLDSIPEGILDQILAGLNITEEQLIYNYENAERLLIASAIAILVFAVLRGVFAFLQTFTAERNSQRVAFDMRNELFAKIQGLSFSYHDRNQTGQLMIRATDDVEKVRLFIGQGLLMGVGAIILLAGTLLILFSTNVRLTFIALPILPIALGLFMFFGSKMGPMFMRIQKRLDKVNTVLQENLSGIKVVKAFTREKSEEKKFDLAADDLMDQHIYVARLFSVLFPFVILIASLGQALVLYFGGRQMIAGTLSLGEWQEFSLYMIFLFMPAAQLGMIITQMSQASASSTRIFEIIDVENEVVDKADAISLPEVEGRVRFDGVSFRYFNSGEPVLKDVDIDVEPGQTVALLGATGSGKSTIINLLPRFYDPSSGSITIDGYDLRDLELDSLRTQIGIVLQETTLFAGTIQENIAFGKPDASFEDIEAAAKAAAAHDEIMAFPEGYETPVGERGTTLSGGQKQRVAIARALLLNPRILILDDSTSSVDLVTEVEIQQALDKLMLGRTSFVIAQRISTVINADQILVLDKGQIVARGNHEELLETSEIYADIYSSQLIGDIDDPDLIEPEFIGE
ncbi:MAG TPA: ABC transporter ATP-binding protein [Anaerolineales bacterium]|nr:ABC transporter ATP-binding protein [Anaerolineales bacterium]